MSTIKDLTLQPTFRAPMTDSGPLEVTANVVGLRNGGTSTVLINNNSWALLPGESLFFGSQNDVNIAKVFNWLITFDTTAGAVNRLQIFQMNNTPCN